MNAYELVQKWIDAGRMSVSDNEIRDYGNVGEVALTILKTEYKAKYCPGEDAHFCGYWEFHNPNAYEKPIYSLYCCHRGSCQFSHFINSYDRSPEAYERLINEIVRMEYENIWWCHKEQIPWYIDRIKKSFHNNYYIGNQRIWTIQKETIWTT